MIDMVISSTWNAPIANTNILVHLRIELSLLSIYIPNNSLDREEDHDKKSFN